MFWYRVIAIVLFGSIPSLTVDAATASATDALQLIPPCGLQCVVQELPRIGCDLSDIKCLCASNNSTEILQSCMLEKCTLDQAFELITAQATICDRPHDSFTNSMRATACVTGMIPVIAVAMRFASRRIGGSRFWWDDWVHFASAILCVPLCAVYLLNVEAGLGKHLWDLSLERFVAIGRLTYISTIVWGMEMLLLKYSILCLYLRIFPNVWLKRAVFAFMALTASFTVPLIFCTAFQCIPVRAVWDLEASKTAKCLDWIVVLRLTVVYEVFTEIVLFGLPIPIVLKLQMATSKKIQLCVFFGLGLFIIGVSIARVPFLKGFVDKSDQTYTLSGTAITAFVASALGHFCAAVPAVRALIRFVMNGFKKEAKGTPSYAKQSRSYELSDQRTYKSLEGSKNAPKYSGDSHNASKQRSGVDTDPYMLPTLRFNDDDGDDDHRFGVPRAVKTNSKLIQAEDSQDHQGGKWPATVTSNPVLGDSASDTEILVRKASNRDLYT